MSWLTTREVAKLLKVCEQRVRARISQDKKVKVGNKRFPSAVKCTCGQAWLVHSKDIVKK